MFRRCPLEVWNSGLEKQEESVGGQWMLAISTHWKYTAEVFVVVF